MERLTAQLKKGLLTLVSSLALANPYNTLAEDYQTKKETVQVANTEWYVENVNPNSDITIYYVPNSHIREDMQRDYNLLEQLVSSGNIDAIVFESLVRKENDFPYTQDETDTIVTEENRKLIESTLNKGVKVYGSQDVEVYRKAVSEVYAIESKVLFRLYFDLENSILKLEKRKSDLGYAENEEFPSEEYNHRTFNETLTPIYLRTRANLSQIIGRQISDNEAQQLSNGVLDTGLIDLDRLTKEVLMQERDKLLYQVTGEITKKHKRIAVEYGEAHFDSHSNNFSNNGFNVLKAKQEELQIDISKKLKEGTLYVPEKISEIMLSLGTFSDFIHNYKNAVVTATRKALLKNLEKMRDSMEKIKNSVDNSH